MAAAGFGVLFLVIMAVAFVPLAFWIYAVVEVGRAPDAAFGPPWDNGKNPWLIGLIVSIVIPAGSLVTTILWWMQGHKALRAGQLVPKPFWAQTPSYPPPYYQVPPPPGAGWPGASPYAPPGPPPPPGQGTPPPDVPGGRPPQ